MKNVSAALEYMHSKGYIHRDLTSSNLLVTDNYDAKVNSTLWLIESQLPQGFCTEPLKEKKHVLVDCQKSACRSSG